jgi:hypothetical protein
VLTHRGKQFHVLDAVYIDIHSHIGLGLSILAQHIDQVVLALLPQVELAHVGGVLVSGDLEVLSLTELVNLVLGDVLHLCVQDHLDALQVGRHLEVKH